MRKVYYLTVKVELDIDGDEETATDVVQELDYEFKSTTPGNVVADTEIVDIETSQEYKDRN